MDLTALKKVTVIAERLLRDRLIADLERLGIRGYAISSVEGEGAFGLRTSDFEGENVQIDTIVSPELADRIFAFLNEHYFHTYSVIAYMQEVQVLRGKRFV